MSCTAAQSIYGESPYIAAYAALDRYDEIADEKDAKAAELEAAAYQSKPPSSALLAEGERLRIQAINIRALTPPGRALLQEHLIGDEYHDGADANETAFRY